MDNLRTGVGSPFVCVDSISLIILKAVLSEHDVMLAFEPIAVHMRWTCSSQANNKINITTRSKLALLFEILKYNDTVRNLCNIHYQSLSIHQKTQFFEEE